MIDKSMKSNRIIGMIQPKKTGELKKPDLHEVGCAGKITSFNETDDGRYLIVLTGVSRFKILNEINKGYTRLQELFIQSVQPIFVPPWNRIDDHLIPLVSELGFCAVSAFGREKPGIELQQINTHIDLIDWRGTRGFVGEDVALIALSNQLSERRHNKNCSKKAIGLMTHHLNHDKETWRFLERLLEVTLHNSACKWMPVETLLEQT